MKLTPLLTAASLMLAFAPSHAGLFFVPEALLTPPAVNPASIVNFGEVPNGTPINGLTIKGFTFSENTPQAQATSSGGPGPTNHISPPEALQLGSFDPATYALTVTMPSAVTSFGFGFAILDTIPTTNALTITLFNGATSLGSLTYPGAPDPTFDGGFAGIGSTDAFTSARITFGPSAQSYAIDNMAVGASSPIPEPGTALFGLALCGVATIRRRR
jgi:hypothetical protein